MPPRTKWWWICGLEPQEGFLGRNLLTVVEFLYNMILRNLIDDNITLVKIMALGIFGAEPLSIPMGQMRCICFSGAHRVNWIVSVARGNGTGLLGNSLFNALFTKQCIDDLYHSISVACLTPNHDRNLHWTSKLGSKWPHLYISRCYSKTMYRLLWAAKFDRVSGC